MLNLQMPLNTHYITLLQVQFNFITPYFSHYFYLKIANFAN